MMEIRNFLELFFDVFSHISLQDDQLFKELGFSLFGVDGLAHDLEVVSAAVEMESTGIVSSGTNYSYETVMQN